MSYKSTYSQIFSPDKIIDTTTVGLLEQKWPDIAVAKDGTVGISWVEHTTSNNYPIQFKKYDVQNDTFYSKTTVQNAPLPSYDDWRTHTQVVFDTAGHPIVCWIYHNYQLMASFIKIARSYDYGATFTAPYFKRFTFDIAPSLIVTENNDLLISWITETPFPWEPEIRFVRMPDCGIVVSDSANVYKYSDLGLEIESQAMTVDNSENIHIFWNSLPPLQEPRQIYYTKSTDYGASFDSSYQILPDTISQSALKTLSISNDVFLTYESGSISNHRVYFSKSNNDSFTTPQTIVHTTTGAFYGHLFSYQKSSGGLIVYNHYSDSAYSILKRSKNMNGVFDDSVFIKKNGVNSLAQDTLGNIFVVSTTWGRLVFNRGNMLITGINHFKSFKENDYELAAYPNPFNAIINFKFSQKKSGKIKIDIYNIFGQKVCTVLNKIVPPGIHQKEWNTSDKTVSLASGIYIVRFQSLEKILTTKILYLK
jgi:hypothetical protein